MSSLLTEPDTPRTPEAILADVYHRAPRLRRRRRIVRLSVGVAVSTLIVALVAFGLVARTPASTTQVVTQPDPTVADGNAPLLAADDGSPAQFVTTSPDAGVTVNDSRTGAVVRTLAPSAFLTPSTISDLGQGTVTPGDLSLSADRRRAYFVASDGGGVMSVFAVATAGGPVRKVLDFPRGNIFWNYAVSPDGNRIAWFRSGAAPASDAVMITDLASGRETIAASGQALGQLEPSWSIDGNDLAVTTAVTMTGPEVQVQIIHLGTGAITTPAPPAGCHYRQPQYVAPGNRLAVLESCQVAGDVSLTGGRLVIVDPDSGAETATTFTIPATQGVTSYSYDRTGNHVLFRVDALIEGQTDAWQPETYRLDGGDPVAVNAPGATLSPSLAW